MLVWSSAVTCLDGYEPISPLLLKKTHFSIAKVLQISADNVYKTELCPEQREA